MGFNLAKKRKGRTRGCCLVGGRVEGLSGGSGRVDIIQGDDM